MVVQFLAAALVLTGAAFAPPAQGRMLLVPMMPGAANGMIARATTDGALLVGRGPFQGSFVIDGSRAAIASAMLSHGVLVIAAPTAGCDPSKGKAA